MTEKKASIYDKDWQKKKELGTIDKTFIYMGLEGKTEKVTATATIHPSTYYEKLEDESMITGKDGLKTLDTNKHTRSIIKAVFGIDGTTLQAIMENKGQDLYNQMREIAFRVSGLSLTKEEVDNEKN